MRCKVLWGRRTSLSGEEYRCRTVFVRGRRRWVMISFPRLWRPVLSWGGR